MPIRLLIVPPGTGLAGWAPRHRTELRRANHRTTSFRGFLFREPLRLTHKTKVVPSGLRHALDVEATRASRASLRVRLLRTVHVDPFVALGAPQLLLGAARSMSTTDTETLKVTLTLGFVALLHVPTPVLFFSTRRIRAPTLSAARGINCGTGPEPCQHPLVGRLPQWQHRLFFTHSLSIAIVE
jgi:hypothetical protein